MGGTCLNHDIAAMYPSPADVVLSYGYFVHEVIQLHQGVKEHSPPHHIEVLPLYILQSVTVPLQGFLNAIVYGWTREDFVNVMAPKDLVVKVDQEELVRDRMDDSTDLLSTEEHSLTTPTPHSS